MTKMMFATALIGAGLMLPGAALAQSAVAIGMPEDFASEGFAMGHASGFPNHAEAEAVALDKCRTFPDATEEVHALCQVVGRYDNACLAVVFDPQPGTWGFGWAIAPTKSAAEKEATEKCHATGKDRADFCRLGVVDCDGKGRATK